MSIVNCSECDKLIDLDITDYRLKDDMYLCLSCTEKELKRLNQVKDWVEHHLEFEIDKGDKDLKCGCGNMCRCTKCESCWKEEIEKLNKEIEVLKDG